MPRARCFPLILALFFISLPRAAHPQAAPPETSAVQTASGQETAYHRPKIGLALSGGGARGVTHIGVLRALERMRIPIDFIAGTSIGSIVGGVYATGATTQDLEALVKSTDWAEVFTDRPPRDKLPFREKDDDRRYIEALNLGIDSKGLHITQGLVNGQKFLFLMEKSTLRASSIDDFDDLPIPFRCVAADLVTGEKFVFSKGSLPRAVRASMSLPGVFSPVREEGHVLVDGGIADNLPVDVVRAMGADVVIAVDIGTPPMDLDEINSPVAVFGQVVNLLMQKEVEIQAANATVLLRPDLGRFGIMDFPNCLKLIPVGEKIVEDHAAALSSYALPPEEYAAWTARVRGLPAPPAVLDFVEFEGTDPADESVLKTKLETQPGHPVDVQKLQEDLVLVYNTGDYEAVNYTLVKRGDRQGVVITATPNALGPNYMSFGIELSSDFKYNSNWSVFAGLRFTRLNRLGAEWKSDLEIGLNQRLYTEWYQPLDPAERIFVVPYFKYTNELDYVFVNANSDDPSANYRTSIAMAGVDLGFNIGRSGELRIGPRWGHANYSRNVGVELFPSFHASIGGYQLTYKYDRLDSADLPTRGTYVLLTAFDSKIGMGATSSYEKAELKVHAYQKLSGRSGIFEYLAGGTSFGSDTPYYDWFRIGGPLSFGGYMPGQLTGPYYGAIRLGYQYEFASLPALVGKGLYFMVYGDMGKTWFLEYDSPGRWDDMKYSGTVGLGSSTKLGPVFFGFSYASENNYMLFLNIGKRW
jgi:NTE family protein